MTDKRNEEHEQEQYSFVQETVKDEQKRPKKLWNEMWKTAGRGLVFGLAACLAFCALKPWADEAFSKQENEVTIPQDEDDADIPETGEEEEVEKEPTYPALTVQNYREMNRALYQVAITSSRCVVEVKAIQDGESWEDSAFDSVNSVSGVIVWKSSSEVLLLAPGRILRDAKRLNVTFSDSTTHPAVLKKQDKNLGLAVLSVDSKELASTTKNQIETAKLGNSNIIGRGDPAIAIGKQFGYAGGVGYGIISTARNCVASADKESRILTTDIPAAKGGSGVLFNTDGEVVGIIDQNITATDSMSMVTAYAISDIKEEIELLSNGRGVPYFGVRGVAVPESVTSEREIPAGIYVKEAEADSPAMEAGIQSGDIITHIGGTQVTSLSAYTKKLMECKVGDTVKIRGQRQGASGYVKVDFDIVAGSKE